MDYAQIIKMDGPDPARISSDTRSATCTGVERHSVVGDQDPAHVSTSNVERQNLTMHMNLRRSSRKIENHAAALHFQFYNFARKHKSLRNPYPGSRAIAAGVADHVWSLAEIAKLANQ